MKLMRFGIVFILALATAACTFAQAPASQPDPADQADRPEKQDQRRVGPDPAEWVPAEALAYIGIADTERLWADIKKTTDYQMTTDKDRADAKNASPWQAVTGKLKEKLAKLLDTTPDELKSPFAGPLALYVTAPRGGGQKDIEPGLIAQIGDVELMQKYLDAALKHLKESAGNYEAVAAGSHTIHVFTTEPGGKVRKGDKEKQGGADQAEGEAEEDFDESLDEPGLGPPGPAQLFERGLDEFLSPAGMPEKLALCLAQGRLVATRSAEHAKHALAQAAAESAADSLAETEDYRVFREQRKLGEVRLVVNLPRIFELLKADAGEDGADELRKVFTVIGADSLRSVVGHLRLGGKAYDAKLELLFLMRGERSGLARLLSFENRPVAAGASVAASTAILAALHVNPPRVLDEVLRLMSQADPEMAREFQEPIEKGPPNPEGQPINLRKDLIEHLAGPLTLSVGFTRPYGPGSLKALLRVGHRNRDAVSRFASQMPGATARDLRGAQLYVDPSGASAIGVTNDQMLVGNVPAVEAALATSESETLADDPTFRRAQRLIPTEAWGVFYLDQRKAAEALAELSKKQDELGDDPVLTGAMLMLHMAGLDFSDTSRTERMLRYARATVAALGTTPEGLQLTLVVLKPQERGAETEEK